MAAPPKPWESPGVNRQQNLVGTPVNNMSGQSPGAAGLPPCCQNTGTAAATATSRSPPPLPTRPGMQSSMYGSRLSNYGGYGGIGGYGGMYGSYGGMYSSPYSSFGTGYGGYGYNRFGNGMDEYNSFSRQAEENSRQAFQSVESIVNAFTSVSMMLDSTFQAVYNSFRAVVGVADNFTRLKMQLTNVISAFALFRTLRYLYRKLLVLLRLRPAGYAEEAWTEASDVVEQLAADGVRDPKKTSWPIFLFFGIILGAPWLIWKLVSRITDPNAGKSWATGEEDHFVARAEFDFKSESQEELSFRAGQQIAVAPKELQPKVKGWLLASVDGKKTGLIPANYVKVLGKKRGSRYNQAIAQQTPGALDLPASGSQQTSLQVGDHCCKEKSSGQSEALPNVENFEQDNSMESVFQGSLEQPGINQTADMNAEDILGENTNDL